MIHFQRHTLANGLKVIVHEDDSTPMVAVNILYNVGARDESPERTGFAHLFEHLMFGGSKNVPDFDDPIQRAGGECNAFTNNDITNYYDIVPAENIEIPLWLESDRMLQLKFSKKTLDTQRKVVVEEFKETCLNRPYGDVWHKLMGLAYKVHPYQWPTIGKTPKHVQDAQLDDVKQFFKNYYCPNNAILVLSGNLKAETGFQLAEKWFGEIPPSLVPERAIPQEPKQKEFHDLEVFAKVPQDVLFLAFHMPGRNNPAFFSTDLLSDVLSNGQSSRLFRKLMKEKPIFSDIDCYVTGSIDPGLLIIEGRPSPGVDMQSAEAAIWKELDLLKTELLADQELQKLKNKVESMLVFSEINITHKAMNLAFFEAIGDASLINQQGKNYQNLSPQDLLDQAHEIFVKENCSRLIYRSAKNN